MTAPALLICDRLAQLLRRLHERLLERTPAGDRVVDQLSLDECLRLDDALAGVEAAVSSKLRNCGSTAKRNAIHGAASRMNGAVLFISSRSLAQIET